MDYLNNVQNSLLEKDLSGLWARYETIANNLANVDTPGYKAQTVSFEDALMAAMDSGNPEKAVQNADITYGTSENLTMRLDGNNVDTVKEQAELARTQLNYSLSIRLLSDEFSRLRHVISEGKR